MDVSKKKKNDTLFHISELFMSRAAPKPSSSAFAEVSAKSIIKIGIYKLWLTHRE